MFPRPCGSTLPPVETVDQETDEVEVDEASLRLQRALKVAELVTAVLYIWYMVDMLDHGSLSDTLAWKWQRWIVRKKRERRERAWSQWVIRQAEQILEEAAS